MALKKYIEWMEQEGASDLFLKTDSPPSIRVGGKIIKGKRILTREEMRSITSTILKDREKIFYEEKDMDISFHFEDKRFRVNLYFQKGEIGIVLREVRSHIPTFQDLNLPGEVLKELSKEKRGMILIAGPAGCGKSTTLASMIEYINQNFSYHIITIEDPIEYIFEEKKSIISQREVGKDTHSFHRALKGVVRESPDVIMIGEIRDRATFEAGLLAAETGALVLTTLHTIDAPETIERILAFFSPAEEEQIRFRFSHILKGIISQRLLPCKDRKGLIPAYSVLLGTPTIKKLIRERRLEDIHSLMEEGTAFGMCTFNQTLYRLIKENKIEIDEAFSASPRPEELKRMIEGIYTR